MERFRDLQSEVAGAWCNAMSNSDKKRSWGFIIISILVLAVFGLVIAYKYTGDFSGFAMFGASRPMNPR
jgi:hypothetical protein